jgi:hypothetical protein
MAHYSTIGHIQIAPLMYALQWRVAVGSNVPKSYIRHKLAVRKLYNSGRSAG